MMLKRTV